MVWVIVGTCQLIIYTFIICFLILLFRILVLLSMSWDTVWAGYMNKLDLIETNMWGKQYIFICVVGSFQVLCSIKNTIWNIRTWSMTTELNDDRRLCPPYFNNSVFEPTLSSFKLFFIVSCIGSMPKNIYRTYWMVAYKI